MDLSVFSEQYFMRQAMREAEKAAAEGEVPVGAIIASGRHILARAHNQTERLKDVTAHAEILAITAASNYLDSKYLNDCTLYVTLEPCAMCAGALFWAQLGRVVYAAQDDKRGFMRFGRGMLHPKTKLEFGVMKAESEELLHAFFARMR